MYVVGAGRALAAARQQVCWVKIEQNLWVPCWAAAQLDLKKPKKGKKEKNPEAILAILLYLLGVCYILLPTHHYLTSALEKKLMIRFGTTSTTVVVAYGCICLVFGSTLLLWQIGKYNVFQLRWKLQSKIHQLCYYFLSLSSESNDLAGDNNNNGRVARPMVLCYSSRLSLYIQWTVSMPRQMHMLQVTKPKDVISCYSEKIDHIMVWIISID